MLMSLNSVTGKFGSVLTRRIDMADDFLASMATAKKELNAAQAKRASIEARASERLAKAQSRYDADLREAMLVEAAGWTQLMAVPGMTAATAAQLGGTTAIKVGRWVRQGIGD